MLGGCAHQKKSSPSWTKPGSIPTLLQTERTPVGAELHRRIAARRGQERMVGEPKRELPIRSRPTGQEPSEARASNRRASGLAAYAVAFPSYLLDARMISVWDSGLPRFLPPLRRG